MDKKTLHLGYYAPTFIFAIISLVSFSIDLQVVPGRLGLLVTLYLIMTNVYNSVKGPESRGFSYIEVWFVGVQMPILAGILGKFCYSVTKKSDMICDVKTCHFFVFAF